MILSLLTAASALAAPGQMCPSPWGGDLILPGAHIVAYESPRAPIMGHCRSEIRECQSGFLTGSFSYPSCSERAQTQPPGMP